MDSLSRYRVCNGTKVPYLTGALGSNEERGNKLNRIMSYDLNVEVVDFLVWFRMT